MYTVYKILNLITNEYYIGVHKTSNPNDSYMGSGILIRKAIKDFGLENFQKEILFSYEEKKDAYDKEKELLVNLLNDNLCLNLSEGGVGGSNFAGKKHSEETKEKLRQTALKQICTEETRKKLSEAGKKRIWSKETRKKLSEAAQKRFMSADQKKKISEKMKDYMMNGGADKLKKPLSNDHKKKISEGRRKQIAG